jgi:HD superfamily phosphohydrolase
MELFAEEQLCRYIEQVAGGRVAHEPKEFNDPIWGTIRLNPLEVTLLDSPLLQRLRRIRQLGVVHLVYMAATHTRLEHSVGVVQQVQRIVDSLNTRGVVAEGPTTVLNERLVETLRLAGLCHDIGHGAMSHVSEYALDGNKSCRRIIKEFGDYAGVSHESQLSEIGAYLLLGSPAFVELLRLAREQIGLAPDPDQASSMQRLVIGDRVDNEVLLAQEIISGPFDADKLDYLARDATMCGVPVVSDVTRLVQKVRVTRVVATDLPRTLQKRLPERAGGYVVSGVARSGGSALIELALARVLMFDKVYRHHAVRSAEAMVFQIIESIAQLSDHPAAFIPFALTDDQLLDLDGANVATVTGRDLAEMSAEELRVVDTISDLAARLRDRRLFVRGFAIAGTMTSDAYREDPEHSLGLKLFLQDLGNPQARSKIKARICERLIQGLETLGEQELLAQYRDNIGAYVHLSPPKPAPKTFGTDTNHAFIVDDDGKLTSFGDDAPETSGWSDALIATHDLGHVFCPKELAAFVYVAAETELRVGWRVRVPDSMLPYTKLRHSALDPLRRRLYDANYFAGLPADLLPDPPLFAEAGFESRVAEAVSKLNGYAGPIVKDNARGSAEPLAHARVKAFVKQFGDDDLVDMALDAIARTRQITRYDVWDAVEGFMHSNPDFDGASLCTLGSIKDSSTLFTNLALDADASHDLHARTLDEALRDDRPIVFVDDFVGRGSQTIDILQNWLGLPATEQLNEERDTLPEEAQERLRGKQLAFVYVAGLDQGKPAIERFVSEAGLDARVYVHIDEAQLPSLDSEFGSDGRLPAFREFCRTTGANALVDYKGKHREDQWRLDRALGYGGHGLLFTSMFNTPTASLTVLWAGGDETGWQPIFPRRSKN